LFQQTYFSAAGSGTGSVAKARGYRRDAAAADYAIVSGTVSSDGGASLDPVYRVTSSRAGAPSDPNGSHCLRFFGSGGGSVDYCFTPQLARPSGQGSFAVMAPWPADTTRLALVQNNVELASLSAASGPASLAFTSPGAGERWEGTHTVSWSGADPDGHALIYTLLYSYDNGASWIPVAIDLPDPQFDLDCTQIGGSTQVLLRVIASSGLTSTSATVGPFEVVQRPALSVSQTAVDFGNVTMGTPAQFDLALRNTGSGPLALAGTLSGAAGFQLMDDMASQVIPAGDRLLLGLQFAPAAAGPAKATLTLTSNDPNQPKLDIPLSGTAFDHAVPSIGLSPSFLDFGSVASGQTKDVKFTVSNSGAADLHVASLKSTNGVFSAPTPATPFTVAAGTQTDVTVRFAPNGPGPASGSLAVATDDPIHGSITVALTGSGTGGTIPAPAIAVSPANLDFGSVTVGSSKDLNLTLQNTGTAPVSISSITSSNARFTVPAGASSIPAGASIPITVRFIPADSSPQNGALTIASNAPTVTVPLTGSGVITSAGSYTLARIEVTRTFVDQAGWSQGIGVLPAQQTLGPVERNFQMGWEFLWGENNAYRNRASALVSLTTVPATVSVGSTAAMAASMVGDWYTSGGYGVSRDHTISLSGAAGTGQWSTVDDPNGAYHGSFTANGSPTAPAAGSNGEVALTTTARLNFGGDHWT